MRVVAGTARSRRLTAPAGAGTRPTSDRVREAVFNALGSLDVIEGASVLDLFAGSGAMGIEALSRGAASCTFVDSDRAAVNAVRTNLDAVGLSANGEVVAADVDGFLARDQRSWDLVLVDPPYAFDGWPELLDRLNAATVVVESDRSVALPPVLGLVREKRYGSTVVTIARRQQESSH